MKILLNQVTRPILREKEEKNYIQLKPCIYENNHDPYYHANSAKVGCNFIFDSYIT